MLEFMVGITRWEVVGEQARGLGARYRILMLVGSAEVGGLVEIVEYDEGRDLAWTSVTGLDMRGRWRLRERPTVAPTWRCGSPTAWPGPASGAGSPSESRPRPSAGTCAAACEPSSASSSRSSCVASPPLAAPAGSSPERRAAW